MARSEIQSLRTALAESKDALRTAEATLETDLECVRLQLSDLRTKNAELKSVVEKILDRAVYANATQEIREDIMLFEDMCEIEHECKAALAAKQDQPSEVACDCGAIYKTVIHDGMYLCDKCAEQEGSANELK